MDIIFWVWLGVIIATIILEIVTLDLVSVWFAIGAIIPLILSAIGGIAIEIQVGVFVFISAILLIFIRKIAQKILFKNMNEKTNLDALIGKNFRLLESTDFEKTGSIKVNDIVWTAVSENGEFIEKDSIVQIVRVEGNKFIIKKIEHDIEDENLDNKNLIENKEGEEK